MWTSEQKPSLLYYQEANKLISLQLHRLSSVFTLYRHVSRDKASPSNSSRWHTAEPVTEATSSAGCFRHVPDVHFEHQRHVRRCRTVLTSTVMGHYTFSLIFDYKQYKITISHLGNVPENILVITVVSPCLTLLEHEVILWRWSFLTLKMILTLALVLALAVHLEQQPLSLNNMCGSSILLMQLMNTFPFFL